MEKYIILPTCSDLNRGDQALVWQTMDLAKKAGYDGTFYMLAIDEDSTKQSQSMGLRIITPILKHPSRKFKSKENNEYNLRLILKWGYVAFFDLLVSLLLLTRYTRKIIFPLLSKNEKQTLKIIKESNACFVKGGGFIHSSGKITDSYTVYYQLFHIILAQSLNKPVFIMPNSFGPFPGFAVEWLVKKTLTNCRLVTVRESISKSMLDQIRVNSDLFPDLGFSLEKNNANNIDVSEIRHKHPNKNLVAITARPYRFPNNRKPAIKYQEYIKAMSEFSKWLNDNDFLPVFIEHTLSETTHEDDGMAISEIVSYLDKDHYELISDTNYDCRDLKSIYSEMDYVVGTRFHSVIFALAENIPSLAISYGGNKGQGIMNDLGLLEFALPIDEISLDSLTCLFQELVRNKDNIKIKLKEAKIRSSLELSNLIKRMRNENDIC